MGANGIHNTSMLQWDDNFRGKGNNIFTPKVPLFKGQFHEISGLMFFHVIRNIRH
jgi:hypothetical protein